MEAHSVLCEMRN